MTNWYEKFRNNMVEAIKNGWDLRAVNTANAAWESHRLGRISSAQAEEIQSLYDAWMASWDEESAAVEAATLGSLAQAGMLAEEAAPAEEEAEPLPMKIYVRADGEGTTFSASEARTWHTSGLDLIVHSRYGKTGVYVHGAAQKAARERDNLENWNHCRRIAEEADAYAAGEVYRCPECGEILHLPDDVGDKYRCPHCGEVSDLDDLEQLSMWDYLADCLDVEYRCGSDREYRSVQIMVAWGGPNIYLDTASKAVELYWWNESARYCLSDEAVDMIDEWAEEYWGCI